MNWNNVKPILLNPALLGTVLGFGFFLFSVKLEGPLRDAVTDLSAMTTPLSMLVVGSILAKSDPRKVFSGWKMYPVLAGRLLIIPLAALLILRPFIHNQTMLGVLVLLGAMPVASLTAIFAEKYKSGSGQNAELASRLIFLSTVFSLVTIPLVTQLL